MATYKCISNFKTSKGKSYSYGDKIGSNEYYDLKSLEQTNFTRQDDDDSFMGPGKPGSIAMGDMLGTGIPGGLDGDMGTLL